jgi:hypothetical protein
VTVLGSGFGPTFTATVLNPCGFDFNGADFGDALWFVDRRAGLQAGYAGPTGVNYIGLKF